MGASKQINKEHNGACEERACSVPDRYYQETCLHEKQHMAIDRQ